MMEDNMTEHGMENLRVYNRGNGSHMLSRTKPKVTPSMANSYAPGSPKPMKDFELESNANTADLINLSQNFGGLNISPTHLDSDETKLENGILENNVDENLKDARIKYLQRNVTVLQARLYQLEGMISNFEALTRDRDQYRGKFEQVLEQVTLLSRDKERLGVSNKQMSEENLQLQRLLQQNTSPGSREEIHKLRLENQSLKKTVDSLSSENSSLRGSLSASDFGRNSPGGSSLTSSQGCTKEMDSLHQVVDTLKATVLQQRNFLLKLRSPQQTNASGLSAGSQILPTTGINPRQSSQGSPRLRQGEEGSVTSDSKRTDQSCAGGIRPEDMIDGLFVHSPTFRRSPPASSVGGTVGVLMSLNGPEISRKNHPEAAFNLPAFDMDPNAIPMAPLGHSGGYLDVADKSNSPLYGVQSNEAIYMNSGDLGLRPPHVNSPKLPRSDNMKSASPKRDPPSVSGALKMDYQGPSQKISHSEIISQRPPNQTQPVRSKTDTYLLRSQLQHDKDAQWQRPPAPPVGTVQQQGDSQQHWPATLVPAGTPVSMTQMPMQASGQSSQYYLHQNWTPTYSNASTAIGTTVERGATRTAIPTAQTENAPFAPNNFNRMTADSSLSSTPPMDRLNSDRLCPVCNRDFGSVSIEQFQSHVLECFDDTENGPDTIVTEEPQRLCPMCNTSFGDNMSQSEFEKHVHSHFGEEHFEVLRP